MRLMKTVARRVAKSLAETKRFARVNESASVLPTTTAATQWSLRHMFTPLYFGGGQGVQSFQFIGNEIVDPYVKMKFSWYMNWNQIRITPTNYATVGLNVVLVACNDQTLNIAGSNFVNASTVSNFDFFYNPDGYNPTFNGNNVKVLAKWSRMVSPDQVGVAAVQGNSVVRGRLKYRWRRKLTFEDQATIPTTGGPAVASNLRGWNYWILTGFRVYSNLAAGAAGIPDAVPQCLMDTYMYYKDP